MPDDKPILILVNKQDLVDLNPLTINETIDLYQISRLERQKKIFTVNTCSAKFGQNVDQSLEWFLNN